MSDQKQDIPRGWHSRGYLPHFDGGEICQFITLHLGDALPQTIIERWKAELKHEKDEVVKALLFRRSERYLDQGYGACFLKKEEIAGQAQESLLYADAVRYKLMAWVVMPNHTHFLIKPINGWELSEIMKRYKSFTAHVSNKMLQRSGQFWQKDYFDRYIRNYDHFTSTINYIENNPVKAGLCAHPGDWPFSSAYFRKHCRSADGPSA